MGVDDAVHVSAVPVDPEMKAVRGIGHSLALDDVQIVVDQDDVVRRRLVEAETETQHVIGAGRLAARSDLSCERGLMALRGENAAGERELLTRIPRRSRQMLLHVAARTLVVLLLRPANR